MASYLAPLRYLEDIQASGGRFQLAFATNPEEDQYDVALAPWGWGSTVPSGRLPSVVP